MRFISILSLLFLLFAFIPSSWQQYPSNWNCPSGTYPQGYPNPVYYDVTVNSSITSAIPKLFPEGKTPNPSLIPNYDILLKLTSSGNVSFTFVYEGAGYRNIFGYFIYNNATGAVVEERVIFPDVTWISEGGCLIAGRTVQVGPFNAGTWIGFYIIADGFKKPNNYKYYSVMNNVTRNPDGKRHMSIVTIDGVVVIGFEDLYDLGDRDYNDVMFYTTVTASYNYDEFPNYSNGTLQVCNDAELVRPIEYNCTQYALLDARNPLACQGYVRVPSGWTLAPDNAETLAAIQLNADQLSATTQCVMLASGRGINPYNLTQCSDDFRVFSSDGRCFATACTNRFLLKGSTVSNCLGTESMYCNPNAGGYVISKFPSSQIPLPIYPLSYNVWLSDTGSASYLNLSFVLTVPTQPKVDVMVLVDLNGATSSMLSSIKSNIVTFYNQLYGKNYNPQVGLMVVDSTVSTGNTRVLTTLTAQTSTLQSAANNLNTNGVDSGTSNVLQALTYEVFPATNLGWRGQGTYSICVIIAKKNYASFNVSALIQSSLSTRTIPIFLTTSSVSNTYRSLVSQLPLAYSSQITDTYSNWYTTAIANIDLIVKLVQFNVANDFAAFPNGFIRSLPNSVSNLSPGSYNYIVGLKYPSGVPYSAISVPFPVEVAVWGYDSIKAYVYVNRAPTIVPVPNITLAEETSASYTLGADDQDRNKLYAIYLSVTPSNHLQYFTTATNSPIALNTPLTELRGVYSPPLNYYGVTTITYKVNDGCADSPVGTIHFIVTNVNDPPTANPILITMLEDTTKTITFDNTYINDVDNTLSELSVALTSLPSSGVLEVLQGSGSWVVVSSSNQLPVAVPQKTIRWTPDLNQNSPPNIVWGYSVTDPGLLSASSTITINVTPVNDPPSSAGFSLRTLEDTPLYITQIVASDPEGDPLRLRVETQTSRGYIALPSSPTTPLNVPYIITSSDWTLVFNPASNEFSTNPNTPYTSFTFSILDSSNAQSPTYTITIYVDPVNDPPTANNFEFTLVEDTVSVAQQTLNFSSYIGDVDNAVNTLTVFIKNPVNSPIGVLVDSATNQPITSSNTAINGQTVRFVPNPNQNGNVTFTYYVQDPNSAQSNEATVTIVVLPQPDPPVLVVPVTFVQTKVGFNAYFTVFINDPDLSPTESENLLLFNNNLGNFVPLLEVTEGQNIGQSLDGTNNHTLASAWPNNAQGSLKTVLHWNPQNGTQGSRRWFLLQATDSAGLQSNIVNVTFGLEDNVPPNITVLGPLFVLEDNSTIIDIFAADPDILDTFRLDFTIGVLPSNGQLFFNGTLISTPNTQISRIGSFSDHSETKVTYVPGPNYNGIDTFTVFSTDPLGAHSSTALVTITVIPVNDPPSTSDISVSGDEDTVIFITTIGGTDVDAGDAANLVLRIVSLPTNRTSGYFFTDWNNNPLSVGSTLNRNASATAWHLKYQAPTNAYSNPPGSNYDFFTFQVIDSSGAPSSIATCNIIVNPVNDPPVSQNWTQAGSEDVPQLVDFMPYISDVDNDLSSLTVIITSLPQNGQLFTSSDGGVTFTQPITNIGTSVTSPQKVQFVPNSNWNGQTSFNYLVQDPSGAQSSSTVTINVTPVNDIPVSRDVILTTPESTPISFTITGLDIENDPLTLTIITLPTEGVVVHANDSFYIRENDLPYSVPQSGDWTFYYIPQQYTFTTVNPWNFSFFIFDGTNTSTLYHVYIYVTPVNDIPTAQNTILTIPEDTPVNFNLTLFDIEDAVNSLVAVVGQVTDGPQRGYFYLDAAKTQLIQQGTVISYPHSVWFFPAQDQYSDPSTSALGSFTFQARDLDGALSVEANVIIYVTPVNDPPRYTGNNVITILEDTVADIALGTQIVDIDSPSSLIQVTVTQTVQRGSLYECTITGSPTCNRSDITGSNVPYVIRNSEFRLVFQPLPNEFGDNYTTFVFTLTDGSTVSTNYIITINVLPVNDPPVIVPFFATLPNKVSIDEDTNFTIEFNVTDIDSPTSSLKAFLTTPLSTNSRIFQCVATSTGSCQPGVEISAPSELVKVADGQWKIFFLPKPDTYDTINFASMVFVAEDDKKARSNPVKLIITVQPINDPPTVNTSDVYTLVRTSDSVARLPLTDITVFDPDAGNKPILVTVTVVDSTGRLDLEGNDKAFQPRVVNGISLPAPCSRLLSDSGVSSGIRCQDSQFQLNGNWLPLLTFYPLDNATLTHKLNIVVDDLGNTDKLQRPLNNSKEFVIMISDETSVTTNVGNSNALTISLLAAGAVALGIVFLVIWRLKDRFKAPTDEYFANLTEPLEKGEINPLYEDKFASGTNPLYEFKQ